MSNTESDPIHVFVAEDQTGPRLALEDALRSHEARDAGITYEGFSGDMNRTLRVLEEAASGKRNPIDCLIMDGTLADVGKFPPTINSGEGLAIIPARRGVLGIGRKPEQDPNLVSLDFMRQDQIKVGCDLRNMTRLVGMMREKGLPFWNRLAVVGNSGTPQKLITEDQALQPDAVLGKYQLYNDRGTYSPLHVIRTVVDVVAMRRALAKS